MSDEPGAAGDGRAAPAVSVVVPVCDRAEMLRGLLEALRTQTFTDHEVVIVDDASSDESAGVADAAAADDPRVVVIRRDQRGGAVAARRDGVAAASGPVLAFTDSDCVPLPEWLETGLREISAGAHLVQGLTRPTGPVRPLERSVWAEREDGLYPTCNVFYDRTAFDDAGGFRTDGANLLGFRVDSRARGLGFGEDTLLGWRVRDEGPTTFAADAIVEHRVLPFDGAATISRAWQAGAFAALVSEVPSLRSTLLVRRVLLGRRGQAGLLGAVVAVALRRPLLASVAAAWWVRIHARRVDRSDPDWWRQLAWLLGIDLVTEAALVAGSVRARSIVL